MQSLTPWWRQAVLYQLYPLSFADSNGDGYGDLKGILAHLDYLSWLGVGAVWLSPIYTSPMADWGYDVADYNDIDPIFGNLEIFDHLLKEVHDRGMKLLLDFVPNHTSIKHAWFKESRSSLDNPKRDWYIWAPPKADGALPNNWLSRFGGSAWELDKKTGQYYMHSYLPEQADLNWRNAELREAMLGVMRFWLKRGVDGFRTDAVYGLVKDAKLRDNPPNPNYRPGVTDPAEQFIRLHSAGQTELFKVLNSFCNVLSEHQDRFLVSEPPFPPYLNLPGLEQLYDACTEHPLHAPFNFNLMTLPWSAAAYRDFIGQYEETLGPDDLPNYVLGNHDRSRLASRVGERRARLLALLQMTLRGMPVVYYGDELGLKDSIITPGDEQDPWGLRVPGYHFGRDAARSPMPWRPVRYGGFSRHQPWQPMAANADTVDVESSRERAGSLLNLYRRLIKLRGDSSALLEGVYAAVSTDDADVFAFTRTSPKQEVMVVLNFSDRQINHLPQPKPRRLLAGTHARSGAETLSAAFAPHEGRLYLMNGEEVA
jgi:alpha-glucosidase